MMHPEILESPWSSYEDKSSTLDQLLVEHYGFQVDAHVGVSGSKSLFSPLEDSTSEVSSIPLSSNSVMFTNDHFHYPIEKDTLQLPSLMDYLSMELDGFEPIMGSHVVVGIEGYPEENEGCFPSQHLSSEGEGAWSPTPSIRSDLSAIQPSLTLPQEGMEIDNQVSVPHMLEACGEAIGQRQKALAELILRSMSQKVSPIAQPLERLAFYLSQDLTNQGDYLKQEASKNFEQAFKAFYQGTPHGKVAHFAANSAILEAVPHDSEVIHIVDFDMGEGAQWPPMIEATARMHKTLKLTSVKWGEESSESVSTPWKFEETRRHLYEQAGSCGLNLKVEERGLKELVAEIKKMNKRGGRRDLLAFNCMVGLPHMGRGRSGKHAMEFLRVVKDLINSSGNRGIVTFGDGGACEKLKNGLEFRSFFDEHLMHHQALLESTESHFPTRLSEARTAMECLFVAPYISSVAWLQKWEEMREDSQLQAEIGLAGCRLSKAILMEVRELLRGNEGSYQARIEGQNGNELVLEWKGTQLLRVSTWGN